MTTVSDNFDRANSSNIGANWSEDVGDFDIESNTLRCVTIASALHVARWVGTALASNNYYVEGIVRSPNNSSGVGLAGRKTAGTGTANTDCYIYYYFGADFSYLSRMDNNAETILATGTAVTAATNYTARLTCNGSTISGTKNGAADVSVTDATYTSGSVGTVSYNGTNISLVFYVNDWTASDLVSDVLPILKPRSGYAVYN